MRKMVLQILVALVLCIPTLAQAKSPRPELNLSNSGLALRGYDPVSYFTAGKPVRGKSSIAVKNAGATYYFTSLENKQKFLKNPRKYLPAYGGYCAYGAATGYKVDGDPNIWHITNGKLYLNITRSIDSKWLKDKKSYINKANVRWNKLKHQ